MFSGLIEIKNNDVWRYFFIISLFFLNLEKKKRREILSEIDLLILYLGEKRREESTCYLRKSEWDIGEEFLGRFSFSRFADFC
jgi:hypothetical protein